MGYLGKLEIILLIGIPLISLIIVPNLAFGTHDEKLWLPGQTFPPPNDGNPIMDAVSFPIPIVNKSPECTNKGKYNSPDCQKVSRYQITSFNNWETLGSVNLDTRCTETARLQEVSKETVTKGKDESFLTQTQNTFEATWEVHADVKTTHTYESPEMYDAVAGTYTGQVEASIGGSYGQTDTTMNNFEHQTSTSFTLQTEEETTQELIKDASNKNIKWGQVQKFVQLKYDVWRPISVPDDDQTLFPRGADPSEKVIRTTLEFPDKTVIRDALIYKAHDLPGSQYFVHTTYLLDAPTTLVTENFAQTGWYCDPVADGDNFDKRRIQQHVNPDYQKTYPKIHFKPEKHNWQILVTDDKYVPISDATVKLGIHSFPIKSGGGVCTSTDGEAKTDKWVPEQ